jgi:flagellar motor protein MotB
MKDLTKMDLQSNSEEVNKLLFDYYMHLSSEAACKGDYVSANSYTSFLMKSFGDNTVLMNLQAKIYAQQGMLTEAGFLWKKCLKIDPDNISFNNALHRINKLQNARVHYQFKSIKLLGGLLLLVVLVLLYSVLLNSLNRQSNDIKQLREQQTAFQNNVDSLIALNKNLSSEKLLDEIKAKLENFEGIGLTSKEEELTVTFNNGLFRKGDHPTDSGTDKVLMLAKVMEPFTGRISLLILGCTDDIPLGNNRKFESDNLLSLARAEAVFKLISHNSRMLNEDILTGTLSKDKVPFKNDSQENRLRNRTVVIKILPKKLL